MLSILIPTLNEEAALGACLERARAVAPGAQILVSDGGSQDRTVEIARGRAQVLEGPPGRGRQLNLACSRAAGSVLLFLHADTLLPEYPLEPALGSLLRDPAVIGGHFGVKFSGASRAARLAEILYRGMEPLGLFFGDSAIFVRREPFLARGGFRRRMLMEDAELSRWMCQTGRVVRAPGAVVTSSRRFAKAPARQILTWLSLYLLDRIGIPDDALARLYPPIRG
jgi:glycosyltransferase involved in cell wall biosynthesis